MLKKHTTSWSYSSGYTFQIKFLNLMTGFLLGFSHNRVEDMTFAGRLKSFTGSQLRQPAEQILCNWAEKCSINQLGRTKKKVSSKVDTQSKVDCAFIFTAEHTLQKICKYLALGNLIHSSQMVHSDGSRNAKYSVLCKFS